MDSYNIAVSVIVPIYNAQKNLHQCIDSILAQTLTNIEIILVDDGSTDSSLSIIQDYAKSDSRVIVLTQENKHAGVARNAGKAIAKGKYLVFWDSDDFFEPTALEEMFKQCEQDNASICVCDVNHYLDDTQVSAPANGYLNTSFLPVQIPFNIDTNRDYILNFVSAHPWNKMFLRSFVEETKLDFQTTKNGNDLYFVINAICMAPSITIVRSNLVYYRINQADSLFGNLTAAPLVPINNWIATRENLIKNDVFPEHSFVNKILSTLIYFLRNIKDWNAFKSTVDFLQNEGLDKLGLRVDYEVDFFNYPWQKEVLDRLKNGSAEDVLIFLHSKTYSELNSMRASRNNMRDKFRDAQKKLKKVRARNTVLKKRIDRLNNEKEQLQTSLDEIYNSKSYRIGSFLTKPFKRK